MDTYAKALEKIKKDQSCKSNYINQICILRNNEIVGSTGPTGSAPTLAIGNVTTGAPGTEAKVVLTKI